MVWVIIYLGCIITIGFSYFFGSRDFHTQGIMCAFFSIWLGMTMLAIVELAHPYHGMMLVPDDPYRYAISRMDAYRSIHRQKDGPALFRPGGQGSTTR